MPNMCYKIKLINPCEMLQLMLSEGAIIGVVKKALNDFNMPCEDVLVEKFDCASEKMVGEEMTTAEYRTRVRSMPGKRQIPRKR